ncbi:MAG: glycosyltransferase family 4 protein [Patescibacteria group bacterium]|nr:glycosyltransferase family 4 protein [Patescibacteria group bacterium]MDE2116367.1 glycosyltransferase family 4 protein [Patescibacteria group bacterium]
MPDAMKVLYLFSGSREGLIEKVRRGEYHGNGFWGMLQLPKYGVEADYIEVEQTYPRPIARWIRRHVSTHAFHVPIIWKIFSYDIVFTSTAFITQLIFALVSPRRPLWVMHDFSIKSQLGAEKTFRQKIFRFMVRRAAGVVTLSLDEKEFLERRFPHLVGRVEFIPFGVDMGFFKPAAAAREQILAVGFDPDRDWKTLIEAVRDIDVPVILATHERRVEKLKPLPPNVSVRSFSPRELVAEYDRSTVVVVPLDTSTGLNDAMGCSTLFEGMAMGKAVVATRTRAMESYVVSGENGLLVPEGDAPALRKALADLLANPAERRRIGENARRYALEHLDIEDCSRRLADFFMRLYRASRAKTF